MSHNKNFIFLFFFTILFYHPRIHDSLSACFSSHSQRHMFVWFTAGAVIDHYSHTFEHKVIRVCYEKWWKKQKTLLWTTGRCTGTTRACFTVIFIVVVRVRVTSLYRGEKRLSSSQSPSVVLSYRLPSKRQARATTRAELAGFSLHCSAGHGVFNF